MQEDSPGTLNAILPVFPTSRVDRIPSTSSSILQQPRACVAVRLVAQVVVGVMFLWNVLQEYGRVTGARRGCV